MSLSEYERRALAEIAAWERREVGLVRRALGVVMWPVDKAGELVMAAPLVGPVLQQVVAGAISLATDAAAFSVRKDSVFKDFLPIAVRRLADIERLDLAQVDAAIGYLAAKYKALAAAEGGAAGAAGPWGIAVDVPVVMGLALRAIAEYATYCGFDIDQQGERQLAMEVLALASGGSDQAVKAAALAQLARTSQQLARGATWKVLEQEAFAKGMRELAKAVGVRLTKRKLKQAVPVAGAAVGAGVNGWFIHQVCAAAWHVYRRRFLERKQGG